MTRQKAQDCETEANPRQGQGKGKCDRLKLGGRGENRTIGFDSVMCYKGWKRHEHPEARARGQMIHAFDERENCVLPSEPNSGIMYEKSRIEFQDGAKEENGAAERELETGPRISKRRLDF